MTTNGSRMGWKIDGLLEEEEEYVDNDNENGTAFPTNTSSSTVKKDG